MKKAGCIIIVSILIITIFTSLGSGSEKQVFEKQPLGSYKYDKGYRYNIQGWIYAHIEGDPYERGFQHGYLLSNEIVDMLNRWSNIIHNYPKIKLKSIFLSESRYQKISERWWNFCKTESTRIYRDKIPDEYKLEMQGIADGASQGSGMLVTFNDILMQNLFPMTRRGTPCWVVMGRPIAGPAIARTLSFSRM